jgi:uncharacterized protein YdcH (DUF465 family)
LPSWNVIRAEVFPTKKEAEMPTDFEELKRRLLQTDEEFRQLANQHHDLDERIHNLTARQHLSEPEQLEEVTLKKRKLYVKDQMESILRRYRVGGSTPHAVQG